MAIPGARDEAWFTDLYTTHYPDIVRYGARRLGEVEASVELAQEVFAVAWRRRSQVPDRGLPWLYEVARRLLANEWRARRPKPASVPVDLSGFRRGCAPPHPPVDRCCAGRFASETRAAGT